MTEAETAEEVEPLEAEELAEEFMEGTLFSKAEKLLEDHEDDILTAVHEQTNSGDIIYVETLLDTLDE